MNLILEWIILLKVDIGTIGVVLPFSSSDEKQSKLGHKAFEGIETALSHKKR